MAYECENCARTWNDPAIEKCPRCTRLTGAQHAILAAVRGMVPGPNLKWDDNGTVTTSIEELLTMLAAMRMKTTVVGR